jgi:hypothetical protein
VLAVQVQANVRQQHHPLGLGDDATHAAAGGEEEHHPLCVLRDVVGERHIYGCSFATSTRNARAQTPRQRMRVSTCPRLKESECEAEILRDEHLLQVLVTLVLFDRSAAAVGGR